MWGLCSGPATSCTSWARKQTSKALTLSFRTNVVADCWVLRITLFYLQGTWIQKVRGSFYWFFFPLNKKCSSWIRGLSQVWRTLLMRFQFFCSNHTRRKIPQRKPCSKTRWGAKPDTTGKDKKCAVWRSLRSAGGDVPWQETLFSSQPGNGNGMGDSTLSSEPLPFWGQGDKSHGLLFSKNAFGDPEGIR